jgi:hypothetical protein
VGTLVFLVAEVFILIGIFAPENKPLFSPRNIFVVAILPALQLAGYLFTHFVKDSFFESDQKWIEEELKRLVG